MFGQPLQEDGKGYGIRSGAPSAAG